MSSNRNIIGSVYIVSTVIVCLSHVVNDNLRLLASLLQTFALMLTILYPIPLFKQLSYRQIIMVVFSVAVYMASCSMSWVIYHKYNELRYYLSVGIALLACVYSLIMLYCLG